MSDDNVIPFPEPVTWTDLGPPADLAKLSTRVLLNSIEAYGFECEAGPLRNSAEWIELKRRLK